jgi:hypothetical protein
MIDQNNDYIVVSFELFNTAKALLDSLDSEYLYDYFRYLDYDHDYTEYYANKVHSAIHYDDRFNYNKFIKNYDILSNPEDKEKLISDVTNILKEDEEYSEESLSEDFKKQLIAVLLYDIIISNISENLDRLAKKYNPTKEQLKFGQFAVYSLTNESYFYESSRCW